MTSLNIIIWGAVQPGNIYEFGARYFQELKEQHAHAPGPAAHSAVELMQDMKAAELQAQLLRESMHSRRQLAWAWQPLLYSSPAIHHRNRPFSA